MASKDVLLDSAFAQEHEADSIRHLDQLLRLETSPAKLIGSNGEAIHLPDSVYRVLRNIVHAMASGQAVSVIPHDYEMTTQEAAALLNVSRPFLIKLLESGEIPYIKVGTHRRVRYQDLLSYQNQRDSQRRVGMKAFTQFLQDEGFYQKEMNEPD